MPLLAIDQGNQRTKYGLFDGETLCKSWAVPTDKHAGADALGAQLPRECGELQLGVSTVVPELWAAWRRLAANIGLPITLFSGTSPTPLRNAYATPETLGPDRLLAAVAAAHLVGMPVIPISLGTATVVDAVSPDGSYLGGMIAPGVGLDIDSLAQAASALPPAQWAIPATAIGHSSAQALSNGLFYHSLGGLRAMIAATREELGISAPLALTGGWAETLAPLLDGVALCDPLLILRGIAHVLSA